MKTFNFKNIKVKLLFWYALVIFLLLFSFSAILMNVFTKQNIKTVDSSLMTIVHDIDHEIGEVFEQAAEDFNEHEEFQIKNLYLKIYQYKDGEFIKYVDTNKEFNAGHLEKMDKGSWQSFTIGKGIFDQIRVVRYALEYKGEPIYVECATTLYDKIHAPLDTLEDTLYTYIPIIFIISILMGYLIVNSSLKTVKGVIDEVKQIGVDGLDKRIKNTDSNDEIEELIDTFNNMLEKIEESVEKIKRFSNDVSHELKTPLTVIRGELELGLRKDRTSDEYIGILKDSLDETKQLQELIDNLLFLSTSNKEQMQKKFEQVDLDEVIFDVILETQYLAKKKQIQVKCEKMSEVNLLGNKLLIKILVGNLVKNAIKYSDNESSVEIFLTPNSLVIKDNGIGMKEEDLKYIFDRFYRVDSSRGRGGYGLGLSIVKSIVDLHGYKITVNSEYGSYSEFTIEFS